MLSKPKKCTTLSNVCFMKGHHLKQVTNRHISDLLMNVWMERIVSTRETAPSDTCNKVKISTTYMQHMIKYLSTIMIYGYEGTKTSKLEMDYQEL